MKRLVVFACLLTIAGCDRPIPGRLHPFAPPGGECEVAMPGEPTERETIVRDIPLRVFTVDDSDGKLSVSFGDAFVPADKSAEWIETRIDDLAHDVVRNNHADITTIARIKLDDKYSGRSVEANLPGEKGRLTARVYLVGNRIYVVEAAGHPKWLNSERTERFLNSLKTK